MGLTFTIPDKIMRRSQKQLLADGERSEAMKAYWYCKKNDIHYEPGTRVFIDESPEQCIVSISYPDNHCSVQISGTGQGVEAY